MNKRFTNSSKVTCVFTDEGIAFGGLEQEVFFPYGSIDGLKLSLLGVLQANHRSTIGSFAVDRKDRAEVKELVQQARERMKTAPAAEPRVVDLKSPAHAIPDDLSPEEKLQEYKKLFIQGAISKEEYDAQKRLLK